MSAGYTRESAVEAELVEAIKGALARNPTQRFGQLVINMIREYEPGDPWHVYDERWVIMFNGGDPYREDAIRVK